MSATTEPAILFILFIIVMFIIYGYFQKKFYVEADMLNHYSASGISVLVQERLSRRYFNYAQADQRINNISSSVPGQNSPHYPDAYLSVEHIMVANELNKSPKYNEAPPSYDEAMKLAMAHSNSLQTYQAEQAQSGQQLEATAATTSTTPIAATHQPPAVPNERF